MFIKSGLDNNILVCVCVCGGGGGGRGVLFNTPTPPAMALYNDAFAIFIPAVHAM